MHSLSEHCSHQGSGSRGLYLAISLVYVPSVMATVFWSQSMRKMGDMTMPGGWTMSMMWMRMPGQSWIQAGAVFLGMWSVMMLAMMLPGVIPVLSRFRQAAFAVRRPAGWLTLVAGGGYFAVWSAMGALVFPLGAALASAEMRWAALSRAVPLVAAITVALAALVQLSAWRARHLSQCVATCVRAPVMSTGSAWRFGVRLGAQCNCCCAGSTAALLAIGVMDLRVMGLMTAANSIERLLPGRRNVVLASLIITIGAAVLLLQGK